MQYEVRTLQNKLLIMLKQFHKVCVANNLVYYLAGGTMIGAVRHQGFIPWDDDVDVVMPRNDYEKFKKNASTILPANLEIKFYENTKNSPMHYIKLIDKNTTLIENKYRNYFEGVYIDVFPLDGAPELLFNRKKIQRKANIYISLILNHCYTNGRDGIRQIYGYIARTFDLSWLHLKLEKIITQFPYESSKYVGNYLGSYGEKEFVPKECFGKPILYCFEDTEFYGPQNYDLYLSSIYGDYMQLPPVNQRINTHQYFFIDLDKPYREYKNSQIK